MASKSAKGKGKIKRETNGYEVGKGKPPKDKQFKKGNPGGPGRPFKLINQINEELKAEGFTPVTESQLVDTYMALMNLPEWKIKQLKDNPATPFMLRTTIARLGTSQGMEQSDRVLDRAFGRVMMRQAIDTKVSVKPMPEANSESREEILKDVKSFLDPTDLAVMNQSSDEPTE